nr:methionine--tRNA ligase subunit beta [Planctomycetota bacterium]
QDAGLSWDAAAQPLLEVGATVHDGEALVPKIEDSAIEAQLAKLEAASRAATGTATEAADASSSAAAYAPLLPTIAFEDFAKIDLRIGRVLSAEKMKKSKKLLRCEVDLGFEVRQILAGVAEHLTPEDLIGKQVVVVANLAARPMLGTESQGMLLMAEGRDGKLSPATAAQEAGATVR